MPPPSDQDVERLARALDALLDGNAGVAEAELAPIAGLTHARRPPEQLPALPREGWPAGTGALTRNPPIATIARVYVRDGFTCVYCSRRTIVPGVLRLLSRQFPEAIPFHDYWKTSETHRVYWDISTSLDHVSPVSRGGDWQAPDNLATACYRCQHQKSNHSLETLGWSRSQLASSGWDGLTRRYRALWGVAGTPGGAHEKWIKAFEVAHSRAGPAPSL